MRYSTKGKKWRKIIEFIKIANRLINKCIQIFVLQSSYKWGKNEELIYLYNKLMIIYGFKSLLEKYNNQKY